jgi:hypothetical protein
VTVTEVEPDERHVLREAGLVVAIGVVLLAVVAAVALPRLDAWRHRHDLTADFDPEPPHGGFRTDGSYRLYSPGNTRFAIHAGSDMNVVEADGHDVPAVLEDVDEVAWVADDVLVAFGQGLQGDYEGLAVVDLGAETVEQVDRNGQTDTGFSPVRIAADGQVVACDWGYDQAASAPQCGTRRYLIDPATAELHPA